jgi:transcription termination/antitermination protein NusG
MDDLNMASAEPAAALPPEATAADIGSSVVQSPAVDAPAAEQASLPAQEQAAVQPEGQAETSAPIAAEFAAPAPVVETAADLAEPKKTEGAAEEKPHEKAEAKPEEKIEEKPEEKSDKMDWYILKVQSNREESIREGLLRRVNIAGLGFFFDQVIVPTEKVTEFKGGKKKVIKRKLYPGYLVVHMEINDDTWFLVRETPGIGDFTGAAGRPSPMLPHEVSRIVAKQEEKSEKAPKLKIAFREGERVKIKEGTFENFEGEVDSIDETNGRVTVMINIFGRSTPVELEYWQIETL